MIHITGLLTALRKWYSRNYRYLLFSITAVSILLLLYRIETYSLIDRIYINLQEMNLPRFIIFSARFDPPLLILMSLLGLLFMRMPVLGQKWRLFIFFMYLFFIRIALLGAVEFFKTYETAFHPDFWTTETSSGLLMIIKSAIAQTTASFYINSAVAIVACSALFFARKSLDKIQAAFMKPVLPVLICVSLILSLVARHYNPDFKDSRSRTLMMELTMNPLYNIMTECLSSSQSSPDFGDYERIKINNLESNSLICGNVYQRLEMIPRGKKYNIVLFFFESLPLKYVHLKHKNRWIAPNWQKIMANGFCAENHYANSPLSASSLLSVLSSAYEYSTRSPAIETDPDISLSTLPEVLKEKGYRTFLIHTGDLRYANQRQFLKSRKFDRVIEYRDLKAANTKYEDVGWGLDDRSLINPTIGFMKQDSSKPFFTVIMPVNPHHPYEVPDDSFRIFKKMPDGIDWRQRNYYKYLNSLHYSDAVMGMLLDRMKQKGLLKNTIVFVFADHGEAFYQHRQNYNHPFFLYEENVHVPFVIYAPELLKSKVTYKGVSRHIDLFPTVMDLLSEPVPSQCNGISLFSGHRQQMALLQTNWKDNLLGLRDGKWKYICKMNDMYEELYDIEKDPSENQNIAEQFPEIRDRFRKYVQIAQSYRLSYYSGLFKKNGVHHDLQNK